MKMIGFDMWPLSFKRLLGANKEWRRGVCVCDEALERFARAADEQPCDIWILCLHDGNMVKI